MKSIGTHHGKKTFYLHARNELDTLHSLHGKNWLALLWCTKFTVKAHKKLIQEILEQQPLFVYCVAPNFNDLEETVIEELCITYTNPDDDDMASPLTFADNDLKGAFAFCTEHAFHEEKEIDEVYVVDLNDEPVPEIEQLL